MQIRRQINKFIIESGVSEAAWLRCIGAQSNSLNKFRSFKGKGAGASNGIYHKAYRFFEQRRILLRKPKSEKRLEQEERWGVAGYSLHHDSGRRLIIDDGRPIDPRIYDIDCQQDNSGRYALINNHLVEI